LYSRVDFTGWSVPAGGFALNLTLLF